MLKDMGAKLFGWVSRDRRALIASAVLVAASAVALPTYLHVAARNRELHNGDALMQKVPTPAEGYLQNRTSQRRDGWFNQAFADSVVTKDIWDARYGTKAQGSLSEISAVYASQLSQAGWNRDAGCVSERGGADSFSKDGTTWYSGCWAKDGFSLTLSFMDARPQYGYVWIDLTMTESTSGSRPAT